MVRARRLVTFWQKLLLTHPPPEDYWVQCRPGGGGSGPVQLFGSFLHHYNIVAETPTQWVIHGHTYTIGAQHGLLSAALTAVNCVLWKRATSSRTLLQGLHEGRDYEASVAPRSNTKDKMTLAFRDLLLSAAVYTPQLAHFRWGKDHHCPACHQPHADWQHYIDHCTHIPRGPALPPDAPACIRYTGNIPIHYNPRPQSLQMASNITWNPLPLQSGIVAIAASDGDAALPPADLELGGASPSSMGLDRVEQSQGNIKQPSEAKSWRFSKRFNRRSAAYTFSQTVAMSPTPSTAPSKGDRHTGANTATSGSASTRNFTSSQE